MSKKEEKRISIITVLIIVVVAIVAVVLCLKLFVFDKADSKNITSNENQLSSIEGEEYVEYDGTTKINTSEYLQEDKYLDDFVFDNFNVYCIDGITRMEFDVYNDSDNRKTLESYKLTIYGEENEAGTIVCNGAEFAAKQTKRLSIVINCDVANMFDVYIEPIYNKVM